MSFVIKYSVVYIDEDTGAEIEYGDKFDTEAEALEFAKKCESTVDTICDKMPL